MTRVEFAYVNHMEFQPQNQGEVYGVTTGALEGTVTLTPLDSGDPPISVPLRNGGFLFPKFSEGPDERETGDGRFLVSFDDGSGGITSKIINKDAAEYFVTLNDLGDGDGTAEAPKEKGDVINSPFSFSLAQNSPNPCRTSTNISFSLPTPSEVEIAVFDLAGRKVLAPFVGGLNAGEHSLALDVSPLPPGVYVYRLSAGARITARKLVVGR